MKLKIGTVAQNYQYATLMPTNEESDFACNSLLMQPIQSISIFKTFPGGGALPRPVALHAYTYCTCMSFVMQLFIA